MTRTLVAVLLALACGATPAMAQVVPLPPFSPEPTATPDPSVPPEPTPAGGQAPPVVDPPAPGLSAVAAGQDAARTGSSGDATLAGPLGLAWTARLPDKVVAVVTGGGRVYASRADDDPSGGLGTTAVEALDAASGRRLWSMPGGGQLAYGEERLAVLGLDRLRVLDATTGALVWEAPASTFADDVLIAGGAVYHRGDGNSQQVARSLADGAVLWQRNVDGTGGAPAVAGDRLYVSGPCHAEAYDRRTGAQLWRTQARCSSGGGGGAAVLWRDRVFPLGAPADELGPVAAADGAKLGGALPGLATGDVGIVTGPQPGLAAVRLTDGAALWRARGAGALGLPGAVAVRRADRRLAIHDAATGAVRWSARLRGASAPGAEDVQTPAPVAGEGRLLISDGGSLLALAPRSAVPRPGSALRSTVGPAGRPFRVRGRIAGPLLPTIVRLQVRAGRRWRSVAQAAPSSDGGVRPRVAVRRNVLARLAGAGLAPSRAVRLFAQPVIDVRVTPARPGGQVRAALRLRPIPGLRRRGRTVAYYVRRGGSRTFRRLGTARVNGVGRGTLRFAPLPPTTRTLFGATCLVGARSLRLGGPDPLTRRCGTATVTVPRAGG